MHLSFTISRYLASLINCRFSSSTCTNQKYHMIGPPDPYSNLSPIKLRPPRNEQEKRLQDLQARVWLFNHTFWKQHNEEFQQCKSDYIAEKLAERKIAGSQETGSKKLTADELSDFYKSFLDEKYQSHMKYLRKWLKLNFQLTLVMFNTHLRSFITLRTK